MHFPLVNMWLPHFKNIFDIARQTDTQVKCLCKGKQWTWITLMKLLLQVMSQFIKSTSILATASAKQ